VAAELVAPGRDAPASVCPLSGAKTPSRAHRVRYANLEDWDFEVSDAFTVPLCAFHNTEIHKTGNERQWSSERKIDPLARSEGSMEDGSALLHKRDSNRTIADRSRMKRLDYAPPVLAADAADAAIRREPSMSFRELAVSINRIAIAGLPQLPFLRVVADVHVTQAEALISGYSVRVGNHKSGQMRQNRHSWPVLQGPKLPHQVGRPCLFQTPRRTHPPSSRPQM
jgi:hypothetical protein